VARSRDLGANRLDRPAVRGETRGRRHAGEVQALHAAAHPGIFKPADAATFPAETVAGLIARPDHHLWVATVDDAVIGYAFARVHHESETTWKHARTVMMLEQMGVTAAHCGRGAGTALLAAVRRRADDRVVDEIRLTVWWFNEGARRFYARHGFAVTLARMSRFEPPREL
jgi:GNAT superfamily N-acetyltransferase